VLIMPYEGEAKQANDCRVCIGREKGVAGMNTRRLGWSAMRRLAMDVLWESSGGMSVSELVRERGCSRIGVLV